MMCVSIRPHISWSISDQGLAAAKAVFGVGLGMVATICLPNPERIQEREITLYFPVSIP
jgi:hypothetical protein